MLIPPQVAWEYCREEEICLELNEALALTRAGKQATPRVQH